MRCSTNAVADTNVIAMMIVLRQCITLQCNAVQCVLMQRPVMQFADAKTKVYTNLHLHADAHSSTNARPDMCASAMQVQIQM